jgi:hypothetical protein
MTEAADQISAAVKEAPSSQSRPLRRTQPRVLAALILAFSAANTDAQTIEQKTPIPGHYLFVFTGDQAKKGNDFLAVIDAHPAFASYGRLVTTRATTQQTMQVHHTEYTMPASGMLFANDHEAGRTFIFDVRDPLHVRVPTVALAGPLSTAPQLPPMPRYSSNGPMSGPRP